MASIVVAGDTSGSVTIAAPAVAGTPTLTLPTTTGTILTTTSPKAGNVIQVVNVTYATQVSNSTNTFADTNIAASITPTRSSSLILIIVNTPVYLQRSSSTAGGSFQLVRGSTVIYTQSDSAYYIAALGATGTELITNVGIQYIDAPATTSSTTYKLQFRSNPAAGNQIFSSWNNNPSSIILMEIAV